MLLNFQKIKELSFNGFNINYSIEDKIQNTYSVDLIIKRLDGLEYKTNLAVPTLSEDKKYIIYNNIVYANPIIGIPPLNCFSSYLNMFDIYDPAYKEGHIISKLNEFEEIQMSSLMKACTGINNSKIQNYDQDTDLNNLDHWHYCRISDFVQTFIEFKIEETINSIIESNIFNPLTIKKSLTRTLMLMRYIGHSYSIQSWKIEDVSSKVRIPDIFRNYNNPKSITSSYLDFSNCSQSKMFNEFSIKSGVKLYG